MTDDFTTRRLRKLRARIETMLDEARPDRYEVDEDGYAPWMAEAVERLVADCTTADLQLMRAHQLLDDVFTEAGIDGGEVEP